MRRTALRSRWTNTGPDAASRRLLRERSGGLCEAQLPGCIGQATETCHRIKKGTGGRHGEAREQNNSLSNLWHGCRSCHRWTHAVPTPAYELGLMLHEHQDPPSEPMVRRCEAVYLSDDGTWTEVLA